jgi:hypothetical protein
MKVVGAILLLFLREGRGTQEGTTKPKKVGPPFFLIDTSDQLCLAGEEFKRCAIDTLFFVVGSPGEFRRTELIASFIANPFLINTLILLNDFLRELSDQEKTS